MPNYNSCLQLSKKNFIKSELKRVMKQFYSHLDGMDCGINLALHISEDLFNLMREGQRLQKELIELDQDCPKKIWLSDIHI